MKRGEIWDAGFAKTASRVARYFPGSTRKTCQGFSGKELVIALGGIMLLCLFAWPAYHKLRAHFAPAKPAESHSQNQ